MTVFSELLFAVYMLAGNDTQRLVLRVTNVKLLTTAVIVNNLAGRVDKCPLNRSVKYCLYTIGTAKTPA